jgi:hypothetical protein
MSNLSRIIFIYDESVIVDAYPLARNCQTLAIIVLRMLILELNRAGLIDLDYAIGLGECLLPKAKNSIVGGLVPLQSEFIITLGAILRLRNPAPYQNPPSFSGKPQTDRWTKCQLIFESCRISREYSWHDNSCVDG